MNSSSTMLLMNSSSAMIKSSIYENHCLKPTFSLNKSTIQLPENLFLTRPFRSLNTKRVFNFISVLCVFIFQISKIVVIKCHVGITVKAYLSKKNFSLIKKENLLRCDSFVKAHNFWVTYEFCSYFYCVNVKVFII